MSTTSTPTPTPPRPWGSSNTTMTSTPTSASRRRPGPHVLSPLSSFAGSPSNSYNASYQPSNLSQTSLLSPKYSSSYSAAPSLAGSNATLATTQPGGPTRFRRGHARKKAAPGLVTAIRSANPDDLDLMQLEDPDEVLRLFPVRDVRGLEKRASDAAAAKVAELRTMVGERYRDLLSAADSIVRMRSAADKLVERLERVEAGVSVAQTAHIESPTKRAPKLITRPSAQFKAPTTLASPPTLSLTIQLLLSLPSHIETLLESASFLEAARLEGVARVVHRELSAFKYDAGDDDSEGGLQDAFPIIERQWESIGSLGAAILRRATTDLRRWQPSANMTAETLAAIIMLENGSLATALQALLDARTHSLSNIFSSHESHSKHGAREVEQVQVDLANVLDIVLQTSEAACDIFGLSSTTEVEGSLLRLLREIEKPSASTPTTEPSQLAPSLCSLPNYPLLSRYLPDSILDFRPFLSIPASQEALRPADARRQLQDWVKRETARVLDNVTRWIHSLHGGARTLSCIRDTVRARLSRPPDNQDTSTDAIARDLQLQLEGVIEDRLEAVYQAQLATLISRIVPCLETLLRDLPTSEADLSTAYHLFEAPLPFPPTQHYVVAAARNPKHRPGADPFAGFIREVRKRVEGRSPLLERGIGEVEAHARELRVDLEEWLGGGGRGSGGANEREMRERARRQYVSSAKETLDGVYGAVASVLDGVTRDIDASLFIGNFVSMLAASKSFTSDLLMGPGSDTGSTESELVEEWQKRVQELQDRSLAAWRAEAVDRAVHKIRDSMNVATASSPAAVLWAWDATRAARDDTAKTVAAPLPTQPSPAVLSALRTLVSATLRVGLHRTQQDPAIAQSLLSSFEQASAPVVRAFLDELRNTAIDEERRREVAIQAAWDVAFLQQIWRVEGATEGEATDWLKVRAKFLAIAKAPADVGSAIDETALQYLQRTQTIFYSILPAHLRKSTATTAAISWLPLGPPPTGTEFKSLVGLVKPGPRLGLLPTRG